MKCNFCDSEDNEVIYEHTRFKKNNVLKCKDCGLVFLELKKDKKEIEKFYNESYREKSKDLPKKSAEEMFNDPVTRNDCENRISWIKNRYGDLKGKRILEIGSSSGYFLDVLSSKGANVTGIELTDNYADYARTLGFDVYSEPIEDIGFENEFDLVVTFHTLEHVFNPLSVLLATNNALKTGGMFMGEVPNQDDWRLKIFDNKVVKRFHYDPNHYYYYSPNTLNNYLKKCGFDTVALETVERYNSLIQLRRILCGEYNKDTVDEILNRDIFSKPEEDVRIPRLDNRQETEFNRIFEKSVNNELMGNCMRWTATKR